jgi:TnpA family transposase
MPVEFLSDEQVAAYGSFVGEPARAAVERFFYLDDADRYLIAQRRADHHRLGFAVQLGTVRAVDRFLEDPLDVPWAAVQFLAEQLEISDASCVKKYVHRSQTPYEHAWEIRDRYGYRSFDEPDCSEAFARFLDGRAWTHAEGPVALFEHAVRWLRRNRVLLPGVTVLARQVAAAREGAETRLYEALAAAARRVDRLLPRRLDELLQVPDGSRVSTLERLRRSPRRSSGPEMVKALQAIGGYGPLEAIARNTINTAKIATQWPDMLRVVTNQVRAYDLLRMFGRDGHPTPLGQAFVEYGRIAKTLHLLALVDPIDGTYQRRMNRQLTVQESRHRLGRKICHGHRGQIRQAYREGQEDQLAALGLVLNAVVLWNTRYLDAIIEHLRESGQHVRDEDIARLSPLGHAHLNCLGRYAFTTRAGNGLRPLRDPSATDDTDGDW